MAPHKTGFTQAITTEECLNCALTKEYPPCGFDYTLLKYIYSHKRYRALDIHVSDLLSCPRKAWFDKQIEYPATAASRLIVTLGTLQHALLEEMEDEHYLAETIVEAGKSVGTADAFYKEGRLLDYKTIRNAKRRWLPRDKHIMQVNLYAFMLKEMGKEVNSAGIQYIDFLGPTKCSCKAFVVPGPEGLWCPICEKPVHDAHLGALLIEVPLWENEKVREIFNERESYLQEHIENNTIPDQVEPDFLCRYCPFLQMCEAGLDEVSRK